MEFKTRCANLEDLPSIIEIHKSAFDGFFLTRMGAPFLKAIYGIVADYPGGILLVTEHDGQPVGFVAGVVDPAEFYASLSANKSRLLWPTLRGLLRDPGLFPLVLANRRRVGQIFEVSFPRLVVESELSSIAVHPLARGKGAGRELVRAFLDLSVQRGVQSVRLTTDATDNCRTHAFYSGLGFHQTGGTFLRRGRTMLEYVLPLCSSPLEAPETLILGQSQ